MANLSLALQGGIASGKEPTFDGQPMQPGTHLRWSFVSSLGFPPGGFQLWRRIDQGDRRIPPPQISQAPANLATYQAPGGPTGAPPQGAPGWGNPDPKNSGWQAWGSLITLPVTDASWPVHYYKAPAPTDPNVVADDIAECDRRLGTLKLVAEDSPVQQQINLKSLREELDRLVHGYPATALASVPLQDSPAGANAPSFSINVMDQLLLLALDPYFARVLGLYFVDTDTAPGVQYDYAIVGYWGNNHAVADVIFPGLAPGSQLARGNATYKGLLITSAAPTFIWRWIKSALLPFDPTCPPLAIPFVNAALAGLSAAQQPQAVMIVANSTSPGAVAAAGVEIAVLQGSPTVILQIAGSGTITPYSQSIGQSSLTAMTPVPFNSSQFTSVALVETGFFDPIVKIVIQGAPEPYPGSFLLIGSVTLIATEAGSIRNLYALLSRPAAITPPPAPGQPYTTFRRRQADIDTTALKLVPHSLFDVEWPAPTIDPSTQIGDPFDNPTVLPPPTQAIGFVVSRKNNTPGTPAVRLPGWISTRSVPTETGSKITTPKLYRYNDSQLPDPPALVAGTPGYAHSVSAFDIFGVASTPSPYSEATGVQKVAAAPTSLRILKFDNSAEAGGAPAPDGSAWVGGTLNLQVKWDAAAFLMYPDILTAEATCISIDKNGVNTGVLLNKTFDVAPPVIKALTATVSVAPNPDGYSFTATVRTTPPLVALAETDPMQILMLTSSVAASSDRYAVRPALVGGVVVAQFSVSKVSLLVAATASFNNQPAYLVSGDSVLFNLDVPLHVPIAQQTARGQVYVTGSTKNPFLAGERIVDPNRVEPDRPEPQSTPFNFTGAQRLVPPVPPTPVPDVNHVYYDPADATGIAGKTLPFTTPGGSGIFGYVLKRAPIQSLAIADIARRLSLGTAFDANPKLAANGENLAAFLASLPQWLTAYNALNNTHATAANVLETGAGKRSFTDHLYGGLLDEELRTLGDLPANATAYARVNPVKIDPGHPVFDSVDGTGYARTLYKLAAVNQAGSFSGYTGSIGPYYTRIVTPPRPPVLYKVQSASTAIIVAWSLDTNPDVAAYLVYRASDPALLADLRYFGQDPTHPVAATSLWRVRFNTQAYPPLSFIQGAGGNIDPRLVAFVPDPRLCARDYPDSIMAEIVLPPGPPPDQIDGVYRLSDYVADPTKPQLGFNYWTPPNSGYPSIKTVGTETRLVGLRVGLGRSVPVVVVATWAGVKRAIGSVTIRRAGFVDTIPSASTLADANAIPSTPPPSATAPNFYTVVAVDIFGNQSAPSKIFAGQIFGTLSA